MPESICWSCARAYAKPDPEGCGFHRVKNKLKYIEQHTFLTAELELKSRPKSVAGDATIKVIKVVSCRHYDRESRQPSSPKEAPRKPIKKRVQAEPKTHCIRGHEYSEENTYITAGGHRECRKCRAEQRKKNRLEGIG